MDSAEDQGSATPVLESTEVDGAPTQDESIQVTEEQWRAMKAVVEVIVNHRDSDGHDASKVFHKKVNKRSLPDYYDVIKEPVAISTLKSKQGSREYRSFAEFVRDCALIVHNAQTYNRPDAGAYIDALTIKGLMEAEFEKLVEKGTITVGEAAFPDLGEIPPVEALPIEEEEEDDDDDDEDDEDDEMDDSDDDGRKKRKRGRPTGSVAKRDGTTKDDSGPKGVDFASKKKRGRPPKVDTPMEARIKNVLKAIRKPKNELGQIMIHHFERLPDKSTMPEYFTEIKEPIAIELIKKRQKRKKYNSVDHFMRDIDTMFNNAKSYNQDESQIYKDAVHLQREAHRLAEAELKRPDSDFVMDEGRIPLPNGILYNNELWQVGDWVHIQNTNDVTKPIVAQIYRTWQDNEGQRWVNACWYYRPEQTVHQHEKHFFPNEVVKTGQYRDHHVDEIIDRCFVMFFTRYSRGRPRGIPPEREVYVCEARYNEEKHRLNKIKTWASCLPDEVRDKDYEMDLFDGLRKVKKVPSPLLHMLKDDAKETDEVPTPQWGAENAPPLVGGIHKGSRDENQSPPPEPTPSPPPPQQPPPPRPVSNLSNDNINSFRRNSELNAAMDDATRAFGSSSTPMPGPSPQPSYPNSQAPPQYHSHSVSPAPVQYHQHGQQSTSYVPQLNHSYSGPPPTATHTDHYSTPQNRYAYQQAPNRVGSLPGTNVNAQRPAEVYHLSDQANLAIPEDIREQFQRDEQGRVLFFTTPPVDVLPPAKKGAVLGHSAKYIAQKLRMAEAMKIKRKLDEVKEREEEAKRQKTKQEEEVQLGKDLGRLTEKSLKLFINQMNAGTDIIYQRLYGDRYEEGKKFEQEKLAAIQAEAQRKKKAREEHEREVKEREHISLTNDFWTGTFLDDVDPRY